MAIRTKQSTPIEQRSCVVDVSSKRRTLNFLVFNFILPILRANHPLTHDLSGTNSTTQTSINKAINEAKQRIAEGDDEYKEILNLVNRWLNVNQLHFNEVFALIHVANKIFDDDFTITSDIPLYNLTQLYFYHSPDDGVIDLFQQLRSALDVNVKSISHRNDSLSLIELCATTRLLSSLEAKLNDISFNLEKYITPDDELKAKALILNLSILSSKSLFLLDAASKMDKYITMSASKRKSNMLMSSTGNFIKAQAVIDTIIMSHFLHDGVGLCKTKCNVNKLVNDFFNNCSAEKIIMNKSEVIKLSRQGALFINYLAKNTFAKFSDFDWFKNYMSFALERKLACDFFSVMAASFIPMSDIDDVLRKAKSAINRTISRDKAMKRKQLNVCIDESVFDEFTSIRKSNNLTQSEFIERAIKSYISTSFKR